MGLNFRAVQDEIQLTPGHAAGVGRPAGGIGIQQARGPQEIPQLAFAAENIEIAGYDHRFGGGAHQGIEVAQLFLAVAVLQGQMNHKGRKVLEFGLDHQPFEPVVEIMAAQGPDILVGQKRVALLVEQGQLAHHGTSAVLVFEDVMVGNRLGHQAGLVVPPRTK